MTDARVGDPVTEESAEPAPLPPLVVEALDLTGALVTAALLLAVALGGGGPGRVLLALAFVTFVPGWAAIGHLRLIDGMSRIALAVALSLALCAALAQVLLWLHLWSPPTMLAALGAVCLAILVTQLARPRLASFLDGVR
ncbi:MAG: hypothetical protein M3010_01030 [Candidatus Dormibacteraeota bacterium]|nr:hypothetical protein [Candidatus Dormibacteraeota bacterium]